MIETHIENLKPGDWITPTYIRFIRPPLPEEYFPQTDTNEWIITGTGEPLQILSIDFPFISIHSPLRGTGSFDIRTTKVKKLREDYATKYFSKEASLQPDPYQQNPFLTDPNSFTLTPTNSQPVDKHPDSDNPLIYCQRCGTRIVESLIEPGNGVWIKRCPQCGHRPGTEPQDPVNK